jgi:hypothetical protein
MVTEVIREVEIELAQSRPGGSTSFGRINTALNHYRTKNKLYKKYIDYYEGYHDLSFATEKWRNAFGGLFHQFADNLCPAIVDAAADRMQLTGFEVPQNPDLGKQLWDFWKRLRMDRKAGNIHEHMFKVGDAYAIVWPDPVTGQVTISPNPAHQIYVQYSDDGETIEWATKLWQIDTKQYRLNLYMPDRIEKYITTSAIQGGIPRNSNAFRRNVLATEPWPVPNPYGRVPVFHFANNAEMGVWGESELHNIIPLQNALNKSMADMLVAMEFVALPQRYATGLELEEDEVTGQPKIPFRAAIDRIWAVGDPEVRFGQFEQADLERFTKVQNDLRLEMARISRTPQHYLGMGSGAQSAFVASMYPSGESLKTAEAPFSAKITDRQISTGDVWEDLIIFAAQISDIEVPENVEVNTIWIPATPKSNVEELDNAKKKMDLGIPVEVIWAELGYTPQEVTAMLQARNKAIQEEQTRVKELAAANTAPVQGEDS